MQDLRRATRKLPVLVVALATASVAGCHRTLTLPPAVGARAAQSLVRGEQVVVPARDTRVRLDTFDEMIVLWMDEGPRGVLHREKASFERPVQVTLTASELEVAEPERVSRYDLDRLESVTFRGQAPERGLIVGGIASAAAVLAWGGTYALARATHDPETDPHGVRVIYWPLLAAGAAAGLSLLVTLPATGSLGVEVSPGP